MRVLRAALLREGRGGALKDYLDIGDPRTMRRLLTRAGLSNPENLTVSQYVDVQNVIRDVALIEELKGLLTPKTIILHCNDRLEH